MTNRFYFDDTCPNCGNLGRYPRCCDVCAPKELPFGVAKHRVYDDSYSPQPWIQPAAGTRHDLTPETCRLLDSGFCRDQSVREMLVDRLMSHMKHR